MAYEHVTIQLIIFKMNASNFIFFSASQVKRVSFCKCHILPSPQACKLFFK